MPFTDKDLHEALGQQLMSFWQLQKEQAEQLQAIIDEKNKEITSLREELGKKEKTLER